MIPREPTAPDLAGPPAPSDRPTQARRRFTILDMIILVAATAVGLAILQNSPKTELGWALSGPSAPNKGASPWDTWITAPIDYFPIVATWTLVVAPLRLIRPRPRKDRLLAPPGIAACFLISLDSAALILQFLLSSWIHPYMAIESIRGRILVGLARRPTYGWLVVAVWSWMMLTRRWRPDPGWIDTLGRVLCLLWISLIPLYLWLNFR